VIIGHDGGSGSRMRLIVWMYHDEHETKDGHESQRDGHELVVSTGRVLHDIQ